MTACSARWMAATANDRFKARYPHYLRVATILALVLTILVFILTPRYAPEPYQLRQTEIQILQLEPPPLVIEPPQEVPVPPRPVLPVEDESLIEDPDICETIIPLDVPFSPPESTDSAGGMPDFVPSATNPLPVFIASPHYPETARLMRLEGTVTVKVRVGADGSVQAVQLHQGSHPLLNRAALDAARKCIFKPALQRTRAVAVWVAIPYRFQMR